MATMHKRSAGTKIVATLGPATSDRESIEAVIRAGVDVVRLNFSHGSREDHANSLALIREITANTPSPVAVLGDLCGPKIRLLELENGSFDIEVGHRVRIVREPVVGNAERMATNHPELIDDINVGDRVLIDDGMIRLRVVDKDEQSLTCECEIGGPLNSRKGINLPDTDWQGDALTEKDRDDARWAASQGLDYLALSFVRRAEDVAQLRTLLEEVKGECRIISKIETRHAIDAIGEIIVASDGIMVARGDLGVEVDVATVPRLQKEIADSCRRAGKPVIVATQMLQSMVTSATPTRAEVSDVANAIYDGVDAVMLSAETAVGKYPVQSVQMLERVAIETEAYDQERQTLEYVRDWREPVSAAIARSVNTVAEDASAKAIFVWTETGNLALLLSKYRSDFPVIALTSSEATRRRVALYYNIESVLMDAPQSEAERIKSINSMILERGLASVGDLVVVAYGPRSVPFGDTGSIIIHSVS